MACLSIASHGTSTIAPKTSSSTTVGSPISPLKTFPLSPSNIIKRRRKSLTDRLEESKAAAKVKSKDKTSKLAIQKDSEFKKLVSKQALLEKKLTNVEGVISNPTALLRKMIPSVVTKVIFPATIIIAIAAAVFDRIKGAFEAGGVLDIRKRILDEAATIPDLQLLLAIRRGDIFFSSDTRVRSQVVQNSVSQDLGEDASLYRQLNLGGNLLG